MSNTTHEIRKCSTRSGESFTLQVIEPREVPLGGPRAIRVNRTLPQRSRSLIGPWCFVDHFGPTRVDETHGMAVARHPHTGLATVTLLFAGAIDHLDSTGFSNTVAPGEVNLMIAGAGVSHSEFTTADTTVLHGVQLWYALPDGLRFGSPGSQHHTARPRDLGAGRVTVFVGALAGASSPVDTRTPALAAQIDLPAGASLELPVDPNFEHGLLLDSAGATITASNSGSGSTAPGASVRADERQLVHVPTGARTLTVAADRTPARFLLIGGPPFGENIIMWWNFVGRTDEEIREFRARWQAEIGGDRDDPLFGHFPEGQPAPLPAPAMPNIALTPRRRAEQAVTEPTKRTQQ